MAEIIKLPGNCPGETVRPLPFDLDAEYYFCLGSAAEPQAKLQANQGPAVQTVVRRPRWPWSWLRQH